MTLIHQKICKSTKLLVHHNWHLYWCDNKPIEPDFFFPVLCVCVCWCRTLEREELRKLYISPPVPAENTPLVYPETGQPWIGRRIDYILYRENSISKHCRTVRVFLLSTLFSLSSFLLSLLGLLDATNSFKTWQNKCQKYCITILLKHKSIKKHSLSLQNTSSLFHIRNSKRWPLLRSWLAWRTIFQSAWDWMF